MKLLCYLSVLILSTLHVFAQKSENCLNHIGIANSLISGAYQGIYSVKDLKQKGDFGIGAPANIDGEITVLNGRVYQTKYTGETKEIKNKAQISYASVNFFRTDFKFNIKGKQTKEEIIDMIDSILPAKNVMYALKIKGHFNEVKTRAFPSYTGKTVMPLSSMLDRQHFFESKNCNGIFVGYRLPTYLTFWSIPGYHFHWISADKKGGGHVVDFIANNIEVDVDVLNSFSVWIPKTAAYKNIDPANSMEQGLKKVENGE